MTFFRTTKLVKKQMYFVLNKCKDKTVWIDKKMRVIRSELNVNLLQIGHNTTIGSFSSDTVAHL